ncbi:MAG: helix-turn-helix domain-containing protein [Mediterranea sp.]|jgi:AraC-like DNA-binding protein|nr:helix-turn-helix domain-containing protein [Mediterranea sp.]
MKKRIVYPYLVAGWLMLCPCVSIASPLVDKPVTKVPSISKRILVMEELDSIKKKQQQIHAQLFLIIGGLVFLTVVVGVYIWHSRRMVNRQKLIYSYIRELWLAKKGKLTTDQPLLAQQPKTEQYTVFSGGGIKQAYTSPFLKDITHTGGADANQEELVIRLYAFLLEEQRFANLEQTSPNEAAAALQTNRTYLREAVKDVTGKTLYEFARELQLDEACRLLELNDNTKVESIALQVGLSQASFYRLFKKRYNLSPNQYREVARKVAKREDEKEEEMKNEITPHPPSLYRS